MARKLIIQIPCLNEEATLGTVVAALPKQLSGIDTIEILVIDDGSVDQTSASAKALGVHHVLRFAKNRGLAAAFRAGLERALELGADYIVNVDADNQYCADDIPVLLKPILSGEADLVVGARTISSIRHFSKSKKLLQALGSAVIRVLSRTDVVDAPSGFRAMNREAAMKTKVFSNYTYTLETIIQAGHKGLSVVSVPIRTNDYLRPSRLIRTTPGYIWRSVVTMLRIFILYRSFAFFTLPGIFIGLVGLALGVRFLLFYESGHGTGHVQSVVLCSCLLGTSFLLIVSGIIADLISTNRKLLETIDCRLQKIERQS